VAASVGTAPEKKRQRQADTERYLKRERVDDKETGEVACSVASSTYVYAYYKYIYIYIHIYLYIYIHLHLHTYFQICIHFNIYTCIFVLECTHTALQSNPGFEIRDFLCVNICIFTCIYTYTSIYVYIHIQMCIYI